MNDDLDVLLGLKPAQPSQAPAANPSTVPASSVVPLSSSVPAAGGTVSADAWWDASAPMPSGGEAAAAPATATASGTDGDASAVMSSPGISAARARQAQAKAARNAIAREAAVPQSRTQVSASLSAAMTTSAAAQPVAATTTGRDSRTSVTSSTGGRGTQLSEGGPSAASGDLTDAMTAVTAAEGGRKLVAYGGTLATVAAAAGGKAAALGVSMTDVPDKLEGYLYTRVSSALFLKKWKPRFVVFSVRAGVLKVYYDKQSLMKGEEPVEIVELGPAMGLSAMKVNTSAGGGGGGAGGSSSGSTAQGPSRIFYRHIAELPDGSAAGIADAATRIVTSTGALGGVTQLSGRGRAVKGDSVSGGGIEGARRVFKWGADSQAEFESWSRAFRASIALQADAVKKVVEQALAIEQATSAADLFRTALASPAAAAASSARRRRSSTTPTHTSAHVGDGSASAAGTVSLLVYLLDDSSLTVSVPRSGTVKEACVAVRRALRLTADADYSLYTRAPANVPGADGWHAFTCLPDVLPIEEVERMLDGMTTTLVYKRRLYLPPETVAAVAAASSTASTGAAATTARPSSRGEDGGTDPFSQGAPALVPDVDTEAAAATSSQDAAHMLAYVEAVYHVTKGLYLVPAADALILAGLQLVADREGTQRAAAATAAATTGARTGTATSTPAAPARGITSTAAVRRGSWSATQVQSPSARRGSLPGDSSPSSHDAAWGLPPTAAAFSVPDLPLGWYKGKLTSVMSAAAMAEYLLKSSVEELAVAVKKEHVRLGGLLEPLAAQKVYVKRCRTGCPEFGAAFFPAAALHRWRAQGPGARAAPPVQPWAAALTREVPPQHWSGDSGLPVLIAVNSSGIFTRPLPPQHAGGTAAAAAAALAATLTAPWYSSGGVAGWQLHPVTLIEVWGCKHSAPVFSYRARERELIASDVSSPQYKEIAAVVHMCVLALMAAREGRGKRHARSEAQGADAASARAATKAAARDARAEALGPTAARLSSSSWQEIQDPATGQTAYWNCHTGETVFSRPAQ